jgi:hypothetical protein
MRADDVPREGCLVTDLYAQIVERLMPGLGLRVSSFGELEEPELGQPTGKPYVVIEAETAMDREIARQVLGDTSGVNALVWDHGWTPRRRSDGRRVTELKLFPAAS